MAFSFTSPPAAPAAAPSAFGVAPQTLSAPSAFGVSTSTFGTPAAAPAPTTAFTGFGTPSNATPNPAPSAFGGFGAAASPVPAPSVFGGFGTPASAAPAPSAFGAFGTTATATAPTSAFAGFAAPKPAAQVSAFGQATTAFGQPQAPQASMFGVPNSMTSQTPQQQQESREKQLAALKLETSMQKITASYNPSDPACRFQHLFYNKVDPSTRHLYTRPNHVGASEWEEAEVKNPDPENYVPAPVVGVEALQKRVVQQQVEVRKLKEYMDSLRKAAKALGGKVRRSEEMVMDASRQQDILSQRLLQAMRKVEVLRCLGLPIQQGEIEFRHRINQLHQSLDKPQSLLGDINSSSAAYKQVRQNATEMQQKLAPDDLKVLLKILAEQQNGINHLTNLVKKDTSDLEIIRSVDAEEKAARQTAN